MVGRSGWKRWSNETLPAFAVSVVAAISWGASPAGAQGSIAVDRWLVSSAFPVGDESDPLAADFLGVPGEVAVLPDRGRTEAGADWKLVRRDSVPALDLEDWRSEDGEPVVVYAHAYVRASSDRTVLLTWSGRECTPVSAWLNGRSVDLLGTPSPDGGRSAPVRIGFGYNTLLIKALASECAFGVMASLAGSPPETLQGIRVRASRPYGDSRTGPEPWVIADRNAGPEPILGWKDDELFGAAGVRVAAFAVTALEGSKLEAKAGGEQVKRDLDWLTPAEPETVLMPFSFKSLHRAIVRGEGLELKLDWRDGKSTGVHWLDPEALLAAFAAPIRLLGWSATAGDAALETEPIGIYDEDDEPHPLAHLIPLPGDSGVTLVGEWKVPGWLSGFTLRLDAEGAPGEYRLASLPVDGDGTVLCSGCPKGEAVQLVVRTTGAWTRFPGVVVMDGSVPQDLDPAAAGEWLSLIDEKGSRKFRERLADGGSSAAR